MVASDASLFESDCEELLIDLLKDQGYSHVYGPDIAPDTANAERSDYSSVLLTGRLRDALFRINPGISENTAREVLRRLSSVQSNSLIDSNAVFHDNLVNGVNVEFKRADGTIGGDRIRVVDFDNPENNEFLVVNQFTVVNERKNRRPDVVLFVNGIPLVVAELKNPADEKATVEQAYVQITNYKNEIPQLFVYNELCVLSDGVRTEVGTISSDKQFFREWKAISATQEATPEYCSLEVAVKGLLNKQVLLDLIRNFIVFEDDGGRTIKKVAEWHQYHAVNKLIETTVIASSAGGNGKCGVIWHTQGSGKSLMMIFFISKASRDPRLSNPTMVVLTDRNDLDDQLFNTFVHCQHILRQTPRQAETRAQLKNLLKVASGGIVFTTINKFFPEENQIRYPMLTDRRNVIVLADEAHRSQYDLVDGFAAHLRDALPNASYVGFTGTPIEMTDRNTVNVFGNYVSIYDIKQSIADGTTVPIYYESRLIRIQLPEDSKELLNEGFEEVSEDLETSAKEAQKRKWAMLESLVGTDERLRLVAKDIVSHYELRQDSIDGKAMIVCMSRRICVQLYDEIIKLRPEWAGSGDEDSVLNVIMTGSATDPPEWQKHIRNKQLRKEMANRYRNPEDPFKIVIVRDMWLTGFDAPCMHTMYIDKPMRGHGLMQAISRVNRRFRDKPGGLIVDYIGIADSLAAAVGQYTSGGGKGDVFVDVDQALPVFFEKYEVCRDIMHGYDWSWWYVKKRSERILEVPKAANFVLGLEDGKSRFIKAVRDLEKAYTLVNTCSAALEKKEDVAFFQTVRSFITKSTKPPQTAEMRDEAIRQMLSSALVSEEPVDVLNILGYNKQDISILSDEFLSRIKAMPERNLAAELLANLLKSKVREISRENIVQSKKFSELIQESLTKYEKRIIDTTQFIAVLIQFAKEMREADARGEKLGLTKEELAFYDALGTDDAAVRLMGDAVLRAIAMDVARAINENLTVDWSIREQARAKMRKTIKRLLTKYGYPPDKKEDATQLILQQAESICMNKEV